MTALVSQNGNAYVEGLGGAWKPIQKYWREPSGDNRNALRAALGPDGVRSQYLDGVPQPERVDPVGYTLDTALMARPGNMDIQLDLFLDYRDNVALYPTFQEYFRASAPPMLAIWGKNDLFFIPPGAEAFKRDNPNAQIELLDTGHFALETHLEDVVRFMRAFLAQALGNGTR